MKNIFLAVAIAAAALSACATVPQVPAADGSTPPAPQLTQAQKIAQTTINVSCAALPVLNTAFQGFAKALKVDATGMAWEAGVFKTASAACATKPDVTNLESIAGTVTAAVLSVSDFMANNPAPAG